MVARLKMTSFNMFVTTFVLAVSIWSSYLSMTNEATLDYAYHFCSNKTTFNPNSPYKSNLDIVLSNLSSNADRESDFIYFSANAGGVNGTSNYVYGIYLCRGDVNSTICHECVLASIEFARQNCPVEKEVIIWYEKCMLRYSSQSFESTMSEFPTVTMVNLKKASNEDEFRLKVEKTMNKFASEAANGAKKFMVQEANISGFDKIYSLVQCTQDLSSQDCTKCLQNAISSLPFCCDGRQGARVLFPSCNVRYELDQFYNVSAPPQTTPYLLSPPSPTDPLIKTKGKSKMSPLTTVGIVVAATTFSLALLVTGCRMLRHKRARDNYCAIQRQSANSEITTIESLQFDLKTIETATNKFSEDYKVGEGGFGEVLKGTLPNGQEVAVKRLSKSSHQGAEEFKNEVVLVAKLQHRNLVRLLGFCLEGGEKMLVYEFVPNKSLDYFLFDPAKQGELDWPKRHNIIGGIARGILYLHEDSRLRVIHRDLKASNILLDADMNPKISDFGMARMFGIDQTEGNTRRIVGTYGYMAPEYAMEGLYSIKSDVFSFGVLLLEILSGRKNFGFHLTNFAPSLLAYAWNLWNEGKGYELMDPLLKDSCAANEFMRYVHIGLLCVQEGAYNRPTMSSIVHMLKSETVSLSEPERPAFSVGRITHDHEHELAPDSFSDNGLTISSFVPR
ncbi:cysteine-rich receptor-like protein kinase 15 [Ziziphus jujuba]|uniref:Cysteine-rich receptor-like protein kinase 15 n=1 Tax=Ziziphus jujuba TaxID=326968 RepID=A0ABM3IDW5_ZIZJJ|nr:cysteine-rich receptor-like protein kinase 15 [Ziziphus jujuba]